MKRVNPVVSAAPEQAFTGRPMGTIRRPGAICRSDARRLVSGQIVVNQRRAWSLACCVIWTCERISAIGEKRFVNDGIYGDIMMRLQVLAFLALMLCLFNAGDTQAAEVVLRLSVQQAASEPIGQNILSFKREVEAGTNGTVKIEIAGKGQVIPDHQVP
jgi:hypothetical protein